MVNSSVGMKILLISNCPLDPNQGSGYVICGYAQRMPNRGHVIEAYGPDDVIWFPKMGRLRRLRLLLGYTFATLNQALRKKFDVIELWGGPGWLAILFLKCVPKRPFIIVARSNGLESHCNAIMITNRSVTLARGFVAKTIESLVEIGFRRSDALTLVGAFDLQFARMRHYQTNDKILTIENPLDEEWLNQEIDFERQPIVGFVGSWLTRKGADLLPTVMLTVLKNAPSSKFLLVGVGDAAAVSIRESFPDNGIVEIIGCCPRDELRYHYSRMAILLAPSIYESFGLVLAEAMSCGAALVSTRVGFAAGLRDGTEFVKIGTLDSVEIASILCRLLTDEPHRKKIAMAGYQRVQSLVWNDAVDRLEDFYGELLNSKGSSY